MKTITLKDKTFELSYPSHQIQQDIARIANAINQDLAGMPAPLFIGVLNGACLFAADLIRLINFTCEITFVKVSSYQGTASTGEVTQLIGLNHVLSGRTVILIEDIVDTGETLAKLHKTFSALNPYQIKVATLLFKPNAYKGSLPVDYIGRSIPNEFIVGFGLDYDGLGRNLSDIYTLKGPSPK